MFLSGQTKCPSDNPGIFPSINEGRKYDLPEGPKEVFTLEAEEIKAATEMRDT